MKKVAVCICGEYRQLDLTYTSWNFLYHSDFECDIYASTWETSRQENKGLGINIFENITEDHYKKYFPNAKIILNKIPESYEQILRQNSAKMYFNWKKAVELVKESNIKYDLLIIIRPDVFLECHENYSRFVDAIKTDRIYGTDWIKLIGVNYFFIDDLIFMGECDTMINFIDEIPLETTTHYGLAKFIISKNLFVERLSLSPIIIRANCIGIPNLSYGLINEKKQEWLEASHDDYIKK
jgi:hypothetical protein